MSFQINDSSFEKQAFIAGIHNNVELTDVSAVELDTQNFKGKVLRFRFEDKESYFEHTEFPVDEEKSRANALNWNEDPDKQYAKDMSSQAKRIAHIMSCFMPKENIKIDADTWEEFCDQVVGLIRESSRGVKLRIKLILDKKDYCRFPSSTVSAWVQRMDQPNKLIINPRFDRIVPMAPDNEPEVAEGAEMSTTGTNSTTNW